MEYKRNNKSNSSAGSSKEVKGELRSHEEPQMIFGVRA